MTASVLTMIASSTKFLYVSLYYLHDRDDMKRE
jgi:hypothetical protein